MPRYYFHVQDGLQDIDEQGHELPDDAAAQREAVRFGGGLLHDDPDLLIKDQDLRIRVTDEEGALRFAVVMLAIECELKEKNRGEREGPL